MDEAMSLPAALEGIDFDSGSEISRAHLLRQRLTDLIYAGVLRHGDKLPPVRDLARMSGLNRSTVQRTYRILVAEGVLRTRVGDGTYVAAGDREQVTPHRAEVRARLRAVLEFALASGFTLDEADAMASVEVSTLRAEHARRAAGMLQTRARFATWDRYGHRSGVDEREQAHPRG
jgi:DNA-binding transcriptional regulator YhcF (GntR family)